MPLTTAEKQLQVLPFARPWSLSVAPVHLLSTRYDNEPVQVIGQPPGANYLTSVLSVVSGCRRWFQMILHFPGLPACTFIWLCSSLWLWGHSTAVKTRINLREKEKEILDEILGPGRYDRRIRPAAVNGTDGPVVVDVNLLFRSFPTISDQDMEYSTILTFREEWMDERLRYSDLKGKIKYLTLTDSEKIWMPDLFFSNERDGHFHNLIVPNVYVRIYPNGHVLYSIR